MNHIGALVLLVFGLMLAPHPAASQTIGPQTAVRQFCQADAMGQRGTIQGWSQIAPLVEWTLEPAWDEVVLIGSYTVGWPVQATDDMFDIEVQYAVSNRLDAAGKHDAEPVESIKFRVRATDSNNWRIVGPPPPPHLFVHRVDAAALQRSLVAGGANFVSNSNFIFHLFRGTGWDIDWVPLRQLLSSGTFRTVETPKAGDLAIYLRDDVPYHAGILENEGVVVSSTLNAGITRTQPDAFPGELKYARLVEPGAAATPTAVPTTAGTEAPPVATEAIPTPRSTATSTPKAKAKGKPKAKPAKKKATKPPARRATPKR